MENLKLNGVSVDMFVEVQIMIFDFLCDNLIYNVLMFKKKVEVDRVFCCDTREWKIKVAYKKFRAIADMKTSFCEVKVENR